MKKEVKAVKPTQVMPTISDKTLVDYQGTKEVTFKEFEKAVNDASNLDSALLGKKWLDSLVKQDYKVFVSFALQTVGTPLYNKVKQYSLNHVTREGKNLLPKGKSISFAKDSVKLIEVSPGTLAKQAAKAAHDKLLGHPAVTDDVKASLAKIEGSGEQAWLGRAAILKQAIEAHDRAKAEIKSGLGADDAPAPDTKPEIADRVQTIKLSPKAGISQAAKDKAALEFARLEKILSIAEMVALGALVNAYITENTEQAKQA